MYVKISAALTVMLVLFANCYKMDTPVSSDETFRMSGGNYQTLTLPEIYVNDVGANGTDALNDTWAFQKAIDSMGGVAIVSRDVIIKRVTSTNNRRQALAIGGVNGLEGDSCLLTYTNGTPPQDGIDIEPDSDTAQNVYIKNCEIANNVGNGIEMNAKTNTTAKVRNIYVNNNFIHNNAYSAYVLHVQNSTINYNRFIQNRVRNQIYAKDTSNCVFTPNTHN